MDEPGRSPRKDVARNRQRLLDAGKEVFAERGLDATLDDIAHRAGVGAGTAYRHFGSRAGIVRAIFRDVAGTFIADAEAALEIEDPWLGLARFIDVFASRQASDRGLHQVFTGGHGPSLDPSDWSALVNGITTLLARAKRCGSVSDDVDFSDIVELFVTMGPLYDLSHATATAIWRRHIEIFLRGIQKGTRPTGIDYPPSLTLDQISAAVRAPN